MTRSTLLSLAAAFSLALALTTSPQTPTLPSLAELNALEFRATTTALPAGAPDVAFLSAALNALWSFRSGAPALEIAPAPPRARGATGTAVYNKAKGGVVFIQAITKQEFGKPVEWANGSGAILESGNVLTNWHVVDESVTNSLPILVYLKPAGETLLYKNLAFSATVAASSSEKDLALLRFVAPPPYNLVKLPLADVSAVEVAQDIHVIGHPRGAKNAWSYSTGVISQIRKDYDANIGSEGSTPQHVHANLLQIQTSINPGNSGGPVLDNNGSILGLVSFGSGENLHFAIAADEIRKFIAGPTNTPPPWRPAIPLSPPRKSPIGANSGKQSSPSPTSRGATARGGPQSSELLEAALPDGRRVLRFDLTNSPAYLILSRSGIPQNLIARAPENATLEAWQFSARTGFTRWRLRFPDGPAVEAGAPSGFPAFFSLR